MSSIPADRIQDDYVPVHKAVTSKPFRTLVNYNLPYWRAYLVGGILAVFFTAVTSALPLLIGQIISGFQDGSITYPKLWLFFVGLLGAAAFSGVARYFQRTLMIGASRHCEYDLRNDFYRHLQRLPRRFFTQNKTGDIMARATNDINYVREFIGPGIMGSVDMIRLPVVIAMMVYLSPKLTLSALVPLPVLTLLAFVFIRYMNKQSKVVQEINSQVSTRVQENLAGARVVRAYGIADREMREFVDASKRYMHENLKLVAVLSVAIPLIGILAGAIIMIIIWNGGSMVVRGEITLATLSAFIFYVILLAFPLAQLGYVLTLYQRGAVSMARINKILAEVPEIRDTRDTDPQARIEKGTIRFEHVSFAYGEHVVLHDIDFEVPAGETIAIVGTTGCGKSTLVSLLTREYEPTGGQILIDGRPLPAYALANLRGAIGYVPQDTFIFSSSIAENLRMGRPEATDAELHRACDIAQFTEALAGMPQGIHTLLGERGINLSGGQKQRLTLARAIVTDPRILILDDALSAVDTHTEERILQGLRSVMSERTSLLISHRVSTVRDAHQILVLDEGRIVERGNHDQLLAQGGLYASMHQRQLLETALEDEA